MGHDAVLHFESVYARDSCFYC